MRSRLLITIVFLVGLLAAGGASALVSGAANIAKQNAYVVMNPPPQVTLATQNAYVVMSPPPQVVVAKQNAYLVVTPTRPQGMIIN